MRHLVLTRRENERLFLHVERDADPVKVLEQLQSGGIMIEIRDIQRSYVKLSIEAPSDVVILREELGEFDVRESRSYRRKRPQET